MEATKATLDLTAAAINMAADQMPAQDAQQAQLTIIRKYIEENLADCTLSVERLIHRFGLSRAKLYRIVHSEV